MIILRHYFTRSLSSLRAYSQDRCLVCSDFDKTIIAKDSYLAVTRLLTPEQRTEQLEALKNGSNWICFIRSVLQLLHAQHGLSATEIGQYIRRVPAVPGMSELMRRLAALPNTDMCILSDSNCFFINEWLAEHGLTELFKNIYTNPTELLSNGQLLVHPYMHQTHCDQCPGNLCKGTVLTDLLQRPDVHYKCVLYFGDSCNDLCAIRCLRARDMACIRRGHEMHDKLPAHRHELSCTVLSWCDGHELQQHLVARDIL